MPTTYNGDGTIPQATNPYNPIAIIEVHNTTPIQIDTGSAHGFNDGDTITQEGSNISAANGTFQITKLSSTSYTLNGTAAGGFSVATGAIAVDYSVSPLVTLPSDGDPRSASSVNPALEESANIVPYLYKRVGQYNFYNFDYEYDHTTTGGNYGTPTTIASGSWTLITGATHAYASPWLFNGSTDLIEIDWNLSVDIPDTGGVSFVAIGASVDGGPYKEILNSMYRCGNGGTPHADIEGPLHLHCLADNTTMQTTTGIHTLSFGVMGFVTSTSILFTLLKPFAVAIKHYRSNI